MIVLGISGGHDANWCVVKDGVLLGAFEKERFNRRRHARGEVASLVPGTLSRLGLSVRDIDVVATSEPVHQGGNPGLRRMAGKTYERIDEFEIQIVELLGRTLPCVSIPHHVAHAAYARYTSPFQETVAITWDGGGDYFTLDAYSSTTVSTWRGGRMEWIDRLPNVDYGSLWFTYSRSIFRDPRTAGKLMGLAAYGSPTLLDEFRAHYVMTIYERGPFVGASVLRSCWPEYENPPFVQSHLTWEDHHAQDIAFAVQAITTEAGVSLARTVRELTGANNLVVAGGVALNGYMNTSIRREAGYRDVSIPPAVDDGGISVGSALFATHHVFEVPFRPNDGFDWATVGMWWDEEEVRNVLETHGLTYSKIASEDAIDEAARGIAREQIVAWFDGRAEHGPRALGSRSLLSAVHKDSLRLRLNKEVKYREPFRPVAPVVPAARAQDYFDLDWESPYMMYIVPVTDRSVTECPAIVHVDRTARVQTVRDDSPFGQIANALQSMESPPMFVNTSFNVKSPIVNSPTDAIRTFLSQKIDMLYIQGHLVKRP